MSANARLAEEAVVSRGEIAGAASSVNVALMALRRGDGTTTERILRGLLQRLDARLRDIEEDDRAAMRRVLA